MQAHDLERRARLRRQVRSYIAELRHYGVSDDEIRECRTILDLDRLKHRTVNELMAAPAGR